MSGLDRNKIHYVLGCLSRTQEKEKLQVQKAEKAKQRLKQKAVKQHQDFKEAVEVLRKHKMDAKRGRLLLKRHYVALIEDAGGVSDPGRISYGLLAQTPAPPVHT